MKIFEIIKQEVPIPEAARRYGLAVRVEWPAVHSMGIPTQA